MSYSNIKTLLDAVADHRKQPDKIPSMLLDLARAIDQLHEQFESDLSAQIALLRKDLKAALERIEVLERQARAPRP